MNRYVIDVQIDCEGIELAEELMDAIRELIDEKKLIADVGLCDG